MGGFGVTLFLALTLLSTVSAQSPSCSFSFSGNREFATCVSLPQLNSFLHWTYHASAGTADIAFRATNVTDTSTGNWVAWALNPTGSGMIGAQALVAFKNSSGMMSAYTSSVLTTAMTTLTPSTLSYTVTKLAAESSGSGQIIVFATIQVPGNKTSVNHVWQVGPLSNDSPAQHPLTNEHQTSFATLDFLAGAVSPSPSPSSTKAPSMGTSPPPPSTISPSMVTSPPPSSTKSPSMESPPPAALSSPAPAVQTQAGSTSPSSPQGSGSASLTVVKLLVTLCLVALAVLLH